MPMIFETRFANDFAVEIRKVLRSKVELVGDLGLENCGRYVVDEPDVQLKREDLNRKKAILSNALQIVSRFHSDK